MKLIDTGSSQCGQVVGFNFENLGISDFKGLSYEIDCRSFLIEENTKVEIIWNYVVFLNGERFFPFDTKKTFFIKEKETEPLDEELKIVIIKTFNHLKESFANATHNAPLLAISDIRPDTIDKTVQELRQLLLPLMAPAE